jgi:hypothetical protein
MANRKSKGSRAIKIALLRGGPRPAVAAHAPVRGSPASQVPYGSVRRRARVGEQAPSAHVARATRKTGRIRRGGGGPRCAGFAAATVSLPAVGRADDAHVCGRCPLLPALLGSHAPDRLMTEPKEIRRYLGALVEPTEAPERRPARGPPYWGSRVLRRRAGDVDAA